MGSFLCQAVWRVFILADSRGQLLYDLKNNTLRKICCHAKCKKVARTNFDEPIYLVWTTKKPDKIQLFLGSGDVIRTHDTPGMNRMLWPTELRRQMVAGEGFEPTTSGL